ncbi:MAG: wyosine biosynthesis protein TYW1 [Candidatus Bathyarchaeota archaeon B23]|nr:MAG: wyosine biosynthesis protein TYW1 [Candidatus Bathyarchaeota archaeon B23]
MPLPEELRRVYARQGYHFVGRHSAVKTCHWVRKSLTTGGVEHCYKQHFYGVPSHRCLQMTPSLGRCLQSCLYCWRAKPEDIGVAWDQMHLPREEADDPDLIVESSIEAHRRAISGFGGNPKVPRELYLEAREPIHAAISLEGEPTLYPRLGELVEAYFNHGFKTVFIVTNGLRPDVIADLDPEPSQLYVSVSAPDEETYRRTCRPLVGGGWRRLMETLELLNSLSCPTVLRHTLLPKYNMHSPEGYARLAELSNATYIEPKAAMSVGYARLRFGYEEMAWHSDIRRFAEALAEASGYRIVDEHPPSSVVLLSQLEKPIRLC